MVAEAALLAVMNRRRVNCLFCIGFPPQLFSPALLACEAPRSAAAGLDEHAGPLR
jgi:hypothetical protein